MYYNIDRFEENKAVLYDEDDNIIILDRNKLPSGAKENDYICFDGVSYVIDREKTESKREELKKRLNKIFNKKKDDGGTT